MAGNQELFLKVLNQGHSAAWDKNWDQAAIYYQQALNEIPDHPQALNNLGLALFELQQFDQALVIGLEDYTADIGVQRTSAGKESLFARSMIINAAKAASIQAVDSVYSDIGDLEGLRESVLEAKSLGFEGKGCIHPRQIAIVHEYFAPTPDELEIAREIVNAYEEAEKQGLGVVSLGSKMIDAPVVKRAQRTIEHAELMN